MYGPRYTDVVGDLPATVPFVGPEVQERARARPFRARLGANESGFGPSPQAVAAMQEAAWDTWKYGDARNHDLRTALADHLGIAPDHIAVGEGIDGLLGLLVRMLVAPGDAVVTSHGAYPTFNYHAAGFGAALHKVAYAGDHEDPQALIAKARETGAKLVYFANPDNPMGSRHTDERVQAMIEAVPEGTLLILDEAYLELAPAGTAPPIAPDDPRVIRMRTFSKIYGMAGARVGYAVAAGPLVAAFDKIRNHFGMPRISQAGALAALGDDAWLADVQRRVAAARDRIATIAAANGLRSLPSATNFVALDCGADGAHAERVLEALIERDVFVRKPVAPPQDRCIRVSAAPDPELDILEEVLPDALAAARTAS